MDVSLTYLKDRIIDEINDAVAYMRKAVENRGKTCGSKFAHVAEQELHHASIFQDMFSAQEKPENISEKDYSAMLKEVLDKFSDGVKDFEAQKKIYMLGR